MIKKTLLATAVSLSLIGSTLVSIEAYARGGKGGGPGQRLTLLERLDSNSDGVLTIEEFSVSNAEKSERIFNRKDSEGDGTLSLQEFSATGGRRGPGNQDDLDESALVLCMEEILGYTLPERPDSVTAFEAADSNDNYTVELEEFVAAGELRAEKRFSELDGDSDGEVTNEEMAAFQAQQQERREAHRTCVDEQRDEEDVLN